MYMTKRWFSEPLREDFEVTSDIPLEMQMMLTFPEKKGHGENDRKTKKFRIKIEEKYRIQ